MSPLEELSPKSPWQPQSKPLSGVENWRSCLRNGRIAEIVLRRFEEEKDEECLLKQFNELETHFLNSESYSLLSSLIGKDGLQSEVAALKLIELGVTSINSKNFIDEESPLHLAANIGKREIVESLISHGADVNAIYDIKIGPKDYRKVSPLASLLDSNRADQHALRQEIFHFLVDAGADPRLGYVNTRPIFHVCLEKGYVDCAKRILDLIDINEKDPILEQTPLHIATLMDNCEWIEILLNRGADTAALAQCEGLFNPRKMSPLHVAAWRDNELAATLLLKFGANLNLKAENPAFGKNFCKALSGPEPLTPFQIAVDRNSSSVVNCMLTHANEQGLKIDTESHLERNLFSGKIEDVMRKGYSSLKLRIETANARMNGHIDQIRFPVRSFCLNKSAYPLIRKCFNKYFAHSTNLLAAEKVCSPLSELLKYYILENKDFAVYFFDVDTLPETTGCYNPDTGEEIVIALESKSAKKVVPVIIHEIAHKAAHLIYNSHLGAPPQKSSFYEALEKDLLQLKKTDFKNSPAILRFLIESVSSYAEDYRPSEYLVRIPHAALYMALENPNLTWNDLKDIFEKSIPHLFHFYMNEFLEECESYIKRRYTP
ncbi:hypothetical protein PHSC3_000539 [Chlamydiales bacterium STE3]|nr:hypothetical protein PHSC3_000539 [Chlamydiales bacterium STE3]